MELQKYKNDKSPEEIQFDIEQELIGVNHYYFERDKEIILKIYMTLFQDQEQIPKFTDIERKVAEYNYDICYKVSVIEFETHYQHDTIGSMIQTFSCSSMKELDKYIDVTSVMLAEIDFLTGEMFNEVCSQRTREIEDFIKEVLDSSDVVYEDDTDYNPLSLELLFNKDEHMIIVNDAQLMMFPEIHADEYGYGDGSKTIYDGYEDICNHVIQRRRKIKNSRLLKSGGE